VLLKKSVSPSSKTSGSWDSIHVFEAIEKNARRSHYKLTSTVILNLGDSKPELGSMDLSGNMVRQVEQDLSVEGDEGHVANIGRVCFDLL
jgi:capping protein beta